MCGGPEKWSCTLFVLHWQLFNFKTPCPVSLLTQLCLNWSWVVTKSCSTTCTDKLPPWLFLLADLALPSHPWSPNTVLFYRGCFVFVFQLYWLPESRGWFSVPQPLFFVCRIVQICITLLSVCVCCCVCPCSFLTGLCNTFTTALISLDMDLAIQPAFLSV